MRKGFFIFWGQNPKRHQNQQKAFMRERYKSGGKRRRTHADFVTRKSRNYRGQRFLRERKRERGREGDVLVKEKFTQFRRERVRLQTLLGGIRETGEIVSSIFGKKLKNSKFIWTRSLR